MATETPTQTYRDCPKCRKQRIIAPQTECYRCQAGIDPDALDLNAERWRTALLETVRPYRDLPLLLSGGMDSTTLLAAQLALGGKPTCYAYELEGWPESADLAMARKLTAHFNLPLIAVPVPSDLEAVVRDTQLVIERAKTARKTAVQCCHALHYLLLRIRKDGYREAITGTGGIVEDNRRAQILGADYRGSAKAQLEAARRKNLLGGDPSSATETMKRFAEVYDVTLREPYSMEPVAEVGLSIPWPEMNWPRQKGIALRAFPEFFGEDPLSSPFWRRNVSLQVDGGIRDLHDKLLDLPDVNRRQMKKVEAIYNDWLKEAESAQQGLF